MSEDTIRLVTIGRIVRRRRRLLTLLVVVGALVGYGTSLLLPPRYTTSASVLLPGAWEERELRTQAQIATSSVVIDRVAAGLGGNAAGGGELRDRVAAEVADGNIITVSGTADTPEHAQRLADRVAREFVAFAAEILGSGTDPDAAARLEELRKAVERTDRRITELAAAADPGRNVESVQTRTDLEKLRTALREAVDKLEQSDPATRRAVKADMVVMGPAARPAGEAPPTRTQLVVGGGLLFLLVAVAGHLVAARMGRRLRTEQDIAAALGSTLLGTVDVPAEGPAHRPGGRGPRALVRRLLGVDVRWDLPAPRKSGDEASRRTRYRRVCARLRDRLPASRLLVVVPAGDEIARPAAERLAAEAASEPGAPSTGYPTLRVVEVPVSRPMLPDRDEEFGALVVVSAGAWTAGELAGIAEACADSGHEVVGVVLAGTVLAGPKRSGRTRRSAAPALTTADEATGVPG
ncbi:Wzz/FepE/Etk N-terminal domain-containing protein [Streptomyces sp. NPDC015130]|uniref:Wzz/FepE/Etk N-terminal domain-containing protein n=1 Tax=Streptomyces sp. NPDC015130 TaxID=3364940 RepID=UPI0036FAF7A7